MSTSKKCSPEVWGWAIRMVRPSSLQQLGNEQRWYCRGSVAVNGFGKHPPRPRQLPHEEVVSAHAARPQNEFARHPARIIRCEI